MLRSPDEPPLKDLPPEVRQVINALDPDIPSIFKRQAGQAAEFVQLLDQGKAIDRPDIRLFLGQLATASFIVENQVQNPRKLPDWLKIDFLVANGLGEPMSKPEELIPDETYHKLRHQWLTSEGLSVTDTYINIDYEKPDCPQPRGCKAYIEYEDLVAAYTNGSLSKTREKLRENGYPLSTIKSNLDSLVLYFHHDIDNFDRARAAFEETGVRFRGPGQDVFEINLETDNQIKLLVKESNDQALAVFGGLRYSEYQPADFLNDYFKICAKRGKSPTLPYRTSFVNFNSRLPLEGAQKDMAITEATRIAGYPVLYKYVPLRPPGPIPRPLRMVF
jgi:hypothetical protein